MQFTFRDKSLNVGVCANIFSPEADEKGINNRMIGAELFESSTDSEAIAVTLLLFCEMLCG